MAGKKYVSDYRIEDSVTPSGRVESKRVYQGVYYRFLESEACIRRLRLHIIVVAVVTAVLLLPFLFTNSDLSRTFYVVLPVALAYVPLYHLLAGARRLGFPEPKFTREHRDKTERRISRASIWLSIFMGIGSVGGIVYCIRRGRTGEEVLCVVSLAIGWLLDLSLLPQRKKARTAPVEGAKD